MNGFDEMKWNVVQFCLMRQHINKIKKAVLNRKKQGKTAQILHELESVIFDA